MNGLPGNLQLRFAPDATVIAGIESQGGRVILLTKNKFTIVDREDYDWLSKYNWYASYNKISDNWYAVRCVSCNPNKRISMQREILGLLDGDKHVGDHIDRNGLNNRRYNLRIADKALNSCNCKIYKNNKSGFRGVVWDRNRKLWFAKMTEKGKTINLGRYQDPIDAAKAFDRAAILYRKDTAILNFK